MALLPETAAGNASTDPMVLHIPINLAHLESDAKVLVLPMTTILSRARLTATFNRLGLETNPIFLLWFERTQDKITISDSDPCA